MNPIRTGSVVVPDTPASLGATSKRVRRAFSTNPASSIWSAEALFVSNFGVETPGSNGFSFELFKRL